MLTRCLPAVQDAKLFDWLVYLYEVWKHVTEEDLYAAARAGLAELLLTGCTQASDHHYLCPQDAGDLFAAEARARSPGSARAWPTTRSRSSQAAVGSPPPLGLRQFQ